MARFKNVSGEARRLGRADGQLVDVGEVVSAGDVTDETEEAYVVGSGDAARAWPKSTWELVPEAKSGTASEKKAGA